MVQKCARLHRVEFMFFARLQGEPIPAKVGKRALGIPLQRGGRKRAAPLIKRPCNSGMCKSRVAPRLFHGSLELRQTRGQQRIAFNRRSKRRLHGVPILQREQPFKRLSGRANGLWRLPPRLDVHLCQSRKQALERHQVGRWPPLLLPRAQSIGQSQRLGGGHHREICIVALLQRLLHAARRKRHMMAAQALLVEIGQKAAGCRGLWKTVLCEIHHKGMLHHAGHHTVGPDDQHTVEGGRDDPKAALRRRQTQQFRIASSRHLWLGQRLHLFEQGDHHLVCLLIFQGCCLVRIFSGALDARFELLFDADVLHQRVERTGDAARPARRQGPFKRLQRRDGAHAQRLKAVQPPSRALVEDAVKPVGVQGEGFCPAPAPQIPRRRIALKTIHLVNLEPRKPGFEVSQHIVAGVTHRHRLHRRKKQRGKRLVHQVAAVVNLQGNAEFAKGGLKHAAFSRLSHHNRDVAPALALPRQ